MLSYATILAIQVLYLLNRADEKGLTISEMKYKARLDATGIGRAVRQLCKHGWLKSRSKYKYVATEVIRARTLHDLVIVMDGAVIMGVNTDPAVLPFWGATAQTAIPHAIRFNQHLGLQFSETLKNITLKELITGTILKADAQMANTKPRADGDNINFR